MGRPWQTGQAARTRAFTVSNQVRANRPARSREEGDGAERQHAAPYGTISQPEVLTARATEWFKARIGDIATVAGQIGKNLGKMFIALIALFFVYRDWERLAAQVRRVLAGFLGERAHGYLAAVGSTTRAVVYGLLVTALVQGTLAGLGYWVAGVSAPILLGLITTLFAMVPFATLMAWGGVGLWPLFQGEMAAGVGVLLWGA